jgi:hypothetical protein
MKTYKRNIAVSVITLAATALCSCNHKELCFDHDTEYQLRVKAEYNLIWHENYDIYNDIDDINLDWMDEWPEELETASDDLTPSEPTGLRVISLRDDQRLSTINVDADGGVIDAQRGGEYSIVLYNNDTETIVFNDTESVSTAKATTRSKTRASYKGSPYVFTKAENTVTEPDILFCGYVESFLPDRTQDVETIEVTMEPIVFTYVIHYEFKSGFEYVALARGALAGMAGSAYVKDGSTTDDVVTVLFDCELTTNGVTASVNSFGIPKYTPNDGIVDENGNIISYSNTYGLNLEVRLKNGNTITFDFDVTDQVNIQPNGGVITVKDIVIPDEAGKVGGSGFDVNVEGWGEYKDIEIPVGK